MDEPSIASSLFGLPVADELDELDEAERQIVRAFLRANGRRPYDEVYAELGRKLKLSVAEVRALERAMVQRVGVGTSISADFRARAQPLRESRVIRCAAHGAHQRLQADLRRWK